MAGRKPPTNPGLWTLLLDKIGFSPSPKKGKKGRKRKPGVGERPGTRKLDGTGDPALDAIVSQATAAAPPSATDSPFAQYGTESGMGFAEASSGFADALGYEAAAAAGFAPPMAEGAPSGTPSLPFTPEHFATPVSPPPPPPAPPASFASPAFAAPRPHAAPEPGKMFNEAALDSSLDALFSGLESGMMSPPPPPPAAPKTPVGAFDAFGLTPPVPLHPPAETAPVAEERPKPPAPIVSDREPVVSPPASVPPAPMLARPGLDAGFSTPHAHGQLPAPQRLTLSSGIDLKGLMAAIDRAPGVAGSMVVGFDGLIILSTLPGGEAGFESRDYLGAQATSLFAGMTVQLEKMKRGDLRRLLLETAAGAMLMTASDMGILVVVSQGGQAMDVAAVLTTIAGALGLG